MQPLQVCAASSTAGQTLPQLDLLPHMMWRVLSDQWSDLFSRAHSCLLNATSCYCWPPSIL